IGDEASLALLDDFAEQDQILPWIDAASEGAVLNAQEGRNFGHRLVEVPLVDRELRTAFNHEYAGEHGLAGEMAGHPELSIAHFADADCALRVRSDPYHSVEQTHLPAMRDDALDSVGSGVSSR